MFQRLRLPVALLAAAHTASAFVIQIDYSYDTSGFFTSNTAARNALTAAANDWSNLLTSPLGAVSTDVFTGSSGGSSASANWALRFGHPTSGDDVTVNTFSLAADTFVIYAGARSLSGSTLGQASSLSASVSLSGGSTGPAAFQSAVDAMSTASNAALTRGLFAPTIAGFAGSFSTATYSLNFGPLGGAMWFDNDTDNNSVTDSAGQLAGFWHFDATIPVTPGLNDFYSVALHEIGHTLGLGSSQSWNNLKSGTTWTGANVIALRGSGIGVIDDGGAHIAGGLSSTRFSDGTLQEVVMDPTLTTGTRKTLTALDAAFAQDLGYSITAIPEPGTVALCAGGFVLGVAGWRRRRSHERR